MKRAVVTGASSGIGKEISRRLLNLGFEVFGISRNITKECFSSKHSFLCSLIYQMKNQF